MWHQAEVSRGPQGTSGPVTCLGLHQEGGGRHGSGVQTPDGGGGEPEEWTEVCSSAQLQGPLQGVTRGQRPQPFPRAQQCRGVHQGCEGELEEGK